MERKLKNNVTRNSKMNNEKTSLVKKCQKINFIDELEIKRTRGITLLALVITIAKHIYRPKCKFNTPYI